MEDCGKTGFHDLLASRKAEEAAWRRYQAASWLESIVGPLGISSHPSEKDFISCLRSGLILCNAINKVQPGVVPKVVENPSPSYWLESQPLPAYQYFENVKNFLVAVEELKLPAFEASDLERDTLEAGSAAKVVDCILALKSYHEYKCANSSHTFYKPVRSPMVIQSASRNNSFSISSDSCSSLDMSTASTDAEIQKLEDFIIKLVAERVPDLKENIDNNLHMSFRSGDMDQMKLFDNIVSCVEDRLQSTYSEKQMKAAPNDSQKESSNHSSTPSIITPAEDLSQPDHLKCCHACINKGNCRHRHLLKMQEKKLLDLKALLSMARKEFENLQSHLQRDLKEIGFQVQEMSAAAFGYHRVLQENRNLYNMVMDLKGNIRVYCRIRPAFTTTSNVIDFAGRDGSLVISDPLKTHGRKVFQFHRVFGPSATQDKVFEDTQPLIRSVMDGYNVCIFAYGQTGSGKTYTMSGPSGGSTKDMGINYLALNDLFQISNERKDTISYVIKVQMVEIYNEQVRDLLAEDSAATTKLEIRSCTGDNGLSLPDAKMHPVESTADVLNLMKLGELNRVVNSTALNNRSSRSHSVLTVHVYGKDMSGSTLRSSLHLVDLAGSERVDKSEVTGDRLKEAQFINKSLSCLGDVITALAQKSSHIPYRNSKLTLLLQDSLGGRAKTLMFAHVSPEGDFFGETVSTLKFAQRVSTIELGAARANKESSEIMQLKEQVENLKKALASKEAQNAQFKKIREPTAVADRSPPRVRRLSIENVSNISSEKTVNADRKGFKTPSIPSRSHVLSLEGPRPKVTDDVSTSLHLGQSQDPESMSKPYASNGIPMIEVYHLNAPRSPTSSSYQKRKVKTQTRTCIPPLQLPTTPNPHVIAINEVQDVSASANGKGSQIRKSLQSIGKLINGSERRNQQNLREALSPIAGVTNNHDIKSPTAADARAIRRRSLAGVPTSGSDRLRRSSLGGKDSDDTGRNAKTPPPVRSSSKATTTTKRWI